MRPWIRNSSEATTYWQAQPYIPPGVYADVIGNGVIIAPDPYEGVVIYQLDYLPIPGQIDVWEATLGVTCTVVPWGSSIPNWQTVMVDFHTGAIAFRAHTEEALEFQITLRGHYGSPLYGCSLAYTEGVLWKHIGKYPFEGPYGKLIGFNSSGVPAVIDAPIRSIGRLFKGMVDTYTGNHDAYYSLYQPGGSEYSFIIERSALKQNDVLEVTIQAYINCTAITSGGVEIRCGVYGDSTTLQDIGIGSLQFTGTRKYLIRLGCYYDSGYLRFYEASGLQHGHYNTSGGRNTVLIADTTSSPEQNVSGYTTIKFAPKLRCWSATGLNMTVTPLFLDVRLLRGGW